MSDIPLADRLFEFWPILHRALDWAQRRGHRVVSTIDVLLAAADDDDLLVILELFCGRSLDTAYVFERCRNLDANVQHTKAPLHVSNVAVCGQVYDLITECQHVKADDEYAYAAQLLVSSMLQDTSTYAHAIMKPEAIDCARGLADLARINELTGRSPDADHLDVVDDAKQASKEFFQSDQFLNDFLDKPATSCAANRGPQFRVQNSSARHSSG